MLLAQRYKYGRIVKPVWMFDSFEGLPPADDRDGPLAVQYLIKVSRIIRHTLTIARPLSIKSGRPATSSGSLPKRRFWSPDGLTDNS